MEQRLHRVKSMSWVIILAAVAAFLARDILTALAAQLFAGYLLMALALPVCRVLEKRMSPSMAATASFALLGLIGLGLLVGLIPPVVRQFQQLTESLPALMDWGQRMVGMAQDFLKERGLSLTAVWNELFTQLGQKVGGAVAGLAQSVGQAVQSASKLFLAPLFAFYLLRDRRRIASNLTLLIPVQHRARAVRAAREMRRETANFLRGQLMVSAFVGVLSAIGLLLVGTPGWLILGLLMGVMELIPYFGPLLGGIPAVLLALQGGLGKALWTVGVLVAVQQVEGGVLSPRLLSGATKLHPLMVLLVISAGGMLGGTLGMLLALPVIVSLRGALRGLRT